jgi:hypothetical protein
VTGASSGIGTTCAERPRLVRARRRPDGLTRRRLEALAQRYLSSTVSRPASSWPICPRTVASMPSLRRSRASPSPRCWSTTLVSAVWPVRRDLARTNRPPDRDPLPRGDAVQARRPPGHDLLRSRRLLLHDAQLPPSITRTSSRGPQWPREQPGDGVKHLVELSKIWWNCVKRQPEPIRKASGRSRAPESVAASASAPEFSPAIFVTVRASPRLCMGQEMAEMAASRHLLC